MAKKPIKKQSLPQEIYFSFIPLFITYLSLTMTKRYYECKDSLSSLYTTSEYESL